MVFGCEGSPTPALVAGVGPEPRIRGKALIQVGGFLATPTAPQMTDVAPNRWREPMNHPQKGGENPRPSGRGGGQLNSFNSHF